MVNITLNRLHREKGTKLFVAETMKGHEAIRNKMLSYQQLVRHVGENDARNYAVHDQSWVLRSSISPANMYKGVVKPTIDTVIEDETEEIDAMMLLASLNSDSPSKTEELGVKYNALKGTIKVAKNVAANYRKDLNNGEKTEIAKRASDAILNVKEKYTDFKLALGYAVPEDDKRRGFESIFNHLKTGLTVDKKTERSFLEDYVAADKELNATADRFMKNQGYVTRSKRRVTLGKYDKPRALLAALEKEIANVLEENALIVKRTLYANWIIPKGI